MRKRGFVMGVAIMVIASCTGISSNELPTLAVLPSAMPPLVPLVFWQAMNGRLDTNGERDTFVFEAQANDNIRLGAVEEGQPIQITLYDAGNVVLASGDAIELTIPTSGTYRVELQTVGEGASNYSLGLSYTDRDDPNQPTPIDIVVGVPTPTPDFGDLGQYMGVLNPNATLNNALTADAPRHVYTVTAREGQFVTLTMSRVSGTVDPFLRLFDADGQLIAVDDNAGGNRTARLLNVRLNGGTYQLQAGGDNTYGDFQLRYDVDFQEPRIEIPTPTLIPVTPYVTATVGVLPREMRLVDHTSVIGTVDSATAFQQYSFFANEGETVTVGVAPFGNSGLRPMFEIYDPDGALIVQGLSSTSNDGGGAYVTGIPISITGAYLVIVSGESDSLGGFSLSYGRGLSRVDNFKGDATANARLSSTLAPKGVRDTWLVSLQAGDIVTLAVSSQDRTLNPAVELADLVGNVLYRAESADSFDTLIRSAEIKTSGQYLIRVTSVSGNQTGNYTLIWRYINLAPSPTPIPQAIPLLAIDDTVRKTEYNFYSFYGLQGQTVHIQVVPRLGSALDPIAVLLASDGSELALGDDDKGTLNPDFTYILPKEGTYTIRVNGYLTGGEFTLTVNWLK